MFEKKGLSNIVTTLLIILLVLVVMGVFWVVVGDLIDTGTENINLGKFTLDFEIKKVQIEDDNVTVVVVRRGPGQGDFIGMNFIFSDGTNSETIRRDVVLQETEEKSFTFILNEISTDNLKTVSVAPIFELSSGKESIGDVADGFEVSEEMKAGITGEAVLEEIGNFEALGYSGMGKVEYGPFSSDIPKLPEFKRAIVDPLDVLPGDNQTFTVHVYSPHGVINVTTTTQLDNSILDLDLQEIGEDGDGNQIFSATWIVNDVHTITYRTHITAIDSEGNENKIELTWTDSCQSLITHGSTSTITSSCSTGSSTVAGLDGGNLIIQGGQTLTIDSGATWVFNSGYSITVDGTITVNGEIKKANLYIIDYDVDGHAPSTTSLSLSGSTRAKDATGWNDCCDSDGNARPGQTNYFTNQRATCGGYDFNCVDGEEKQYTRLDGECMVCYSYDYPFCPASRGDTGWTGASPACGQSSTYVSNRGICDMGDGECDPVVACSSGSRTQGCR